jgi:hypothetical protein
MKNLIDKDIASATFRFGIGTICVSENLFFFIYDSKFNEKAEFVTVWESYT